MDKVDFSAASMLNVPLHPDQKTGMKKTRGKEELREGRKTTFSQILESFTSPGELGPLRDLAPSEETLTLLMDAVHSSGSDLIDRPFPDEILRYKKAVRDFIHYVVENGYELYKDQGIKKKVMIRGEADWKTLVFHQVHIVDEKLDQLAAAILSGQTTQIERVAKLDDIKGLLVDLTVTGIIRERDE